MKEPRTKRRKLNELAVFFGGVVCVIGVWYADYMLGERVTFIAVYLVPIVFVTWFANRAYGFILCLLSIAAWFSSYFMALNADHEIAVMLCNSFLKTGVLAASVLLSGAFKKSLLRERDLSRIDGLTGIFNRRYFYDFLKMESVRAARYRLPLSIAYLDVDDFKKVNDRAGHGEGDKLLSGLAGILKNNVRETDICARLGGDEFGILLIQSDGPIAEKIMKKLAQKIKRGLSQNGPRVTLSIGVATFLKAGPDATRLVELADSLMYEVKSKGKDAILFKVYKRRV
jgi:diguanylate cyclase (GGDEF)-like protein